MTKITNEVEAIDAIAEFANREGFDKKAVERLARYFKDINFKSPVSVSVEGVVPYWVGFYIDPRTTDDKPHSKPNRIEFSNKDNMFGKDRNNRHQIQSAFVVPMHSDVAAPPLLTSTLNLKNSAAGPKVVITSQLKGCTFAIGTVGDDYLMSHAQPKKGATGSELAQAIHRGPIKFQGNEALPSTFLIHPGETIDEKSGLGYGNTESGYKANILGLVVKNNNILGLVAKNKVSYSLSFIVAIIKGQDSIEKVMLVTQKNSKWKAEEVTK